MTSKLIIYTNLHKSTISWLVCGWSNFGAQMNYAHTWIHKIHYGPDLGEATTFAFIVFFVPNHGVCTQMSFCFGIPKLGVAKFLKLGFLRF